MNRIILKEIISSACRKFALFYIFMKMPKICVYYLNNLLNGSKSKKCSVSSIAVAIWFSIVSQLFYAEKLAISEKKSWFGRFW